jgi:atypical dual specificity phosphatase
MGKISWILRKNWSRFMNRPWNFSWVINGTIAGSGIPMSRNDIMWLKNKGIKSIISLTDEPLNNQWIKEMNIEYHHEPLQDHLPPSVKEMDRAVDFIIKQESEGRPIVVHCAAGQGRTGSVLAGYFVKQQGLSALQAINKIRSIRPRSIESAQEVSLSQYENFLNKNKTD